MNRSIIDFFRLIRTGNLVIIALTQVFAYYFLNPEMTAHLMLSKDFILLIFSTVMVAAAGYIINDYMDVKLDLVNKPQKVIVGKSISRRWAMTLHFALSLLAFLFAYRIDKQVAVVVILSSACLWLYSQFLKKTYLTGNLLVALLTANTLFILLVFNQDMLFNGILVYGIFSFLTTLIREIIKDTEDMRGDQKFKCRTLPIVKGVRKTKQVLIWLQTILIGLCVLFAMLFVNLSFSSHRIYLLFLIYNLLFLILPMCILWWLIRIADTQKDFSRLSMLSKLIMVAGIMSMVFWRY